ncbi:hypothetical protein HR060_16765 [Catenovulum sp. SM1970]|uniref:hypothetical protein n=1 Tax=Marinifaba aquimaris TaxID=2741323 RepID=UPI0015744AD9|nr:hypothetical protein [Marinifaba aquimaris]NTS78498.1 hypothetical protein [Marinifaba aquimaris]
MSNATWRETAVDTWWNNDENWSTNEVPWDIARFSETNINTVSFDPNKAAIIDSINFDEDACAYNFYFTTSDNPSLTVKGEGVFNHSQYTQNFCVMALSHGMNNPQLLFKNKAVAGGQNIRYHAGPVNFEDAGGGVIRFIDESNAGAAQFYIYTGAKKPQSGYTVGAEVSFGDNAKAGTASFTVYGTLGTDGDTFGNAVFHDESSAENATFTNQGGTVDSGDGGNTQFYQTATAANACFYNKGATHPTAFGGDVAFDSQASGGFGTFHNYASSVNTGYGGVTSFNNNPPQVSGVGASAGHGKFYNYGAVSGDKCGGGHCEFSSKNGSPTAEHGTFYNYGSKVIAQSPSTAGHTIFSLNAGSSYTPTAGSATFYNFSAEVAGGTAGYTEFTIYGQPTGSETPPTAGNAHIYNHGSNQQGAYGGYTAFKMGASAGQSNIQLLAGVSGGYGGKVIFADDSTAGSAMITAYAASDETGGGEVAFYDSSDAQNATLSLGNYTQLSLSYHNGTTQLGTLQANNCCLDIALGQKVTDLAIADSFELANGSQLHFYFIEAKDGTFETGTQYKVLSAPNLSSFNVSRFSANDINSNKPVFSLSGNSLYVSYQAS